MATQLWTWSCASLLVYYNFPKHPLQRWIRSASSSCQSVAHQSNYFSVHRVCFCARSLSAPTQTAQGSTDFQLLSASLIAKLPQISQYHFVSWLNAALFAVTQLLLWPNCLGKDVLAWKSMIFKGTPMTLTSLRTSVAFRNARKAARPTIKVAGSLWVTTQASPTNGWSSEPIKMARIVGSACTWSGCCKDR